MFNAQGQQLRLGVELGRGGEATVYQLRDESNKAVKLYHRTDEKRLDKLKAMIARIPQDPIAGAGHLSLAWPQELVFDETGQGVGFVMPRVDCRPTLALHQLYNPKARRQRAAGTSWRYLVRIARNLCAVVAALHRAGYVVGDLNESNILVTDQALVSLVDCDSVQVRDGMQLYRCLVAKGEYLAPELQGKALQTVVRRPKHDTFALAVLIFLLLMEGVHPFTGVYQGEGEPPPLLETIRRRQSAFLGAAWFTPAPGAPSFDTLPKELRRLFRRAFTTRFRRPSAARWQRAFETLEQNLKHCVQNPQHSYSAHLKQCPWCERSATFGLEAFPGQRGAVYINRDPKPTTKPNLPSTFRGGLWSWLKAFFVTTSLAMVVSGFISYGLGVLVHRVGFTFLFARLLSLVGFFLLILGAFIMTYLRTRASPFFYKRLKRVERLARAGAASSFLALSLSFAIGSLTGSGNVFEGDWLFLPSLWLLSFWLINRHLQKAANH